jgi:hypothetical protein
MMVMMMSCPKRASQPMLAQEHSEAMLNITRKHKASE